MEASADGSAAEDVSEECRVDIDSDSEQDDNDTPSTVDHDAPANTTGARSNFANRLRGKMNHVAKRTQERGRMLGSNVLHAAKQQGDRIVDKVIHPKKKATTTTTKKMTSKDDDGGVEATKSTTTTVMNETEEIHSSAAHSSRSAVASASSDGHSGSIERTEDQAQMTFFQQEETREFPSDDVAVSNQTTTETVPSLIVSAEEGEVPTTETPIAQKINTKMESVDAQGSEESSETQTQDGCQSHQNKDAVDASSIDAKKFMEKTTKPDTEKTKKRAKSPFRNAGRPKSPRPKLAAKRVVAAAKALRETSKDVGKSLVKNFGSHRTGSSELLEDDTQQQQQQQPSSSSKTSHMQSLKTAHGDSNGENAHQNTTTAVGEDNNATPVATKNPPAAHSTDSSHSDAVDASHASSLQATSSKNGSHHESNHKRRKEHKTAVSVVAAVAKKIKTTSKDVGKSLARNLTSKKGSTSPPKEPTGSRRQPSNEKQFRPDLSAPVSQLHISQRERTQSDFSIPEDDVLPSHSLDDGIARSLHRRELNVIMISLVHCAIFVLDQLVIHRHVVLQNEFPVLLILGWMLLAFVVGIQIDKEQLISSFERVVMNKAIYLNSEKDEANIPDDASRSSQQSQGSNRLQRFASRVRQGRRGRQRPARTSLQRTRAPSTTLSASASTLARQIGKITTIPPSIQLSLQRMNRQGGGSAALMDVSGDGVNAKEDDGGTASPDIDPSLGNYDANQASASKLSCNADLTPFFELRGMDIFLSEDPEEEASTHPFLIQNGLRNVPTFIVNIMTQWGNIFLYFRMPDWIKDFEGSLTEDESDDNKTKALKRFLKGDDKYRQERLKVVPCLVSAPLPVRMMAPKDAVLTIHRSKMLNTIYHFHGADANTNSCCTVEVTLDLIGSKAIRGMAGIVKRYLKSIALDLALVIRSPGGKQSDGDEPDAVLGLWCLKNLNIDDCQEKPDRYEGIDPAAIEESETLLAQKYAHMANVPSSSSTSESTSSIDSA